MEYWRRRALHSEKAFNDLKIKTVSITRKLIDEKNMVQYLHEELVRLNAELATAKATNKKAFKRGKRKHAIAEDEHGGNFAHLALSPRLPSRETNSKDGQMTTRSINRSLQISRGRASTVGASTPLKASHTSLVSTPPSAAPLGDVIISAKSYRKGEPPENVVNTNSKDFDTRDTFLVRSHSSPAIDRNGHRTHSRAQSNDSFGLRTPVRQPKLDVPSSLLSVPTSEALPASLSPITPSRPHPSNSGNNEKTISPLRSAVSDTSLPRVLTVASIQAVRANVVRAKTSTELNSGKMVDKGRQEAERKARARLKLRTLKIKHELQSSTADEESSLTHSPHTLHRKTRGFDAALREVLTPKTAKLSSRIHPALKLRRSTSEPAIIGTRRRAEQFPALMLARRRSFAARSKKGRGVVDHNFMLTVRLKQERMRKRLTMQLFKLDPAIFPKAEDAPLPALFATDSVAGMVIEKEKEDIEALAYNLRLVRDLYAEKFFAALHWNFVAVEKGKNENLIISVLREPLNGAFSALVNSKKGFTEFSIPAHLLGNPTPSRIEKYLMSSPSLHLNSVYMLPVEQVPHDILMIERKHAQLRSKLLVGVVFCKQGQNNPLEMFKNKSSSEFEKFLSLLGFDKSDPKAAFIWQASMEVHYHVSTHMDAEGHRRLIGNDRCIIFFKEEGEPFDASGVDSLGTMPQCFVLVQPHKGKYRIGFFRRVNLREFGPHVPFGHLWAPREICDFILTKVYNGIIMTMYCPPMSRLFEVPRQATIDDIVKKYPKAEKSMHKIFQSARKRTDSVGAIMKKLKF